MLVLDPFFVHLLSTQLRVGKNVAARHWFTRRRRFVLPDKSSGRRSRGFEESARASRVLRAWSPLRGSFSGGSRVLARVPPPGKRVRPALPRRPCPSGRGGSWRRRTCARAGACAPPHSARWRAASCSPARVKVLRGFRSTRRRGQACGPARRASARGEPGNAAPAL